jgi:hypothetical protein
MEVFYFSIHNKTPQRKGTKEEIMKPVKTFFSLVFMVMIVSCGGGGGGGSSSGGGSNLSCENNGLPKFSISADGTATVGQQFTETYSWCDSDGDITEVWTRVTYRGVTTSGKFTPAEMGISDTSGTRQNKYNWTASTTGDFFMDWWVKDAKGNTSNVVSLKVTVTAKETGQPKVSPSLGGGIIEKALRQMN